MKITVESFFNQLAAETENPDEVKFLTGVVFLCHDSVCLSSFVECVSQPLVDMLCERTKILPKKQLEAHLKQLNAFMNNEEAQEMLLEKFYALNDSAAISERFARFTLFRLVQSLFEKLYIYIAQEMHQQSASSPPVQDSDLMLPENEEEAFKIHVEKIIFSYYKRGLKSTSPHWLHRLSCIRRNFVTSVFEDKVSSSTF